MKLATLRPTTIAKIGAPPSPTAATGLAEGRRCTRRWTAAEKAGHLASFAAQGAQGLSQAEYCRQAGVSPATFCYWARQARARGGRPVADGRKPTFTEVVLAPDMGSVPSVIIHSSGGAKVEATVGTDPVWLAHLLKAMASA